MKTGPHPCAVQVRHIKEEVVKFPVPYTVGPIEMIAFSPDNKLVAWLLNVKTVPSNFRPISDSLR